MTEKKCFSYNATRDCISLLINVVLFIIVPYFLGNILILLLDAEYHSMANAALTMYIVIAGIFAIYCGFDIISNHFKLLVICQDEIVYMKGILFKSQTIIPANKVRSCNTYSGPLQRKCNTMNLSITTAGDNSEIYFRNIKNGEEAARLISELAKKNANTSTPSTEETLKMLSELIKKNES